MTTSTNKIRWGVLGYAKIAYEHVIPAILRADNAVFQAIASRDPGKLGKCRKEFNCPTLHSSYEALLRDPEVDAIYIPLPNSLHREWTIKAAEHGKHVLCEKPIALNAVECREMIAVCEKHNVMLMEAFMYRYSECTHKIMEILRSGVLGEIKYIYSAFRFLLADANNVRSIPELGGGSLYDVGCYPLNFVGMIVDEIARLQSASGGRSVTAAPMPESFSVQCVKDNGVDVLFSGLLKYPGGLIASINCGFNAHLQVESQIVGTTGVLKVPYPFFGEQGVITLATMQGHKEETISFAASDRYRLEVEDFSDAILNKRAPFFRLAETLRNMEIMDKLYAAC